MFAEEPRTCKDLKMDHNFNVMLSFGDYMSKDYKNVITQSPLSLKPISC